MEPSEDLQVLIDNAARRSNRASSSYHCADFGYDQVSIIEWEKDTFLNLPDSANGTMESGRFGVHLHTHADGVEEYVDHNKGTLSLVLVRDGRKRSTGDAATLAKLTIARTAARDAALSGDDDTYLWATARIAATGLGEGRYSRMPNLPALFDDEEAASLLGMDLDAWNPHAIALDLLPGNYGNEIRYLVTLIAATERGLEVSPEALTVCGHWWLQPEQLDRARVFTLLPEKELSAAFTELNELGWFSWPATIPELLDIVKHADIRAEVKKVDPSIKATEGGRQMTKGAYIDRIAGALSPDDLHKVAQALGVQFDRPVCKLETIRERFISEDTDPLATAVARMESGRRTRYLPGAAAALLDEIEEQQLEADDAATIDVGEDGDDELPYGELLVDTSNFAPRNLDQLLQRATEIAAQMLAHDPIAAHTARVVADRAMELIDLLGDAAQRRSDD